MKKFTQAVLILALCMSSCTFFEELQVGTKL